MVSVIIPVYNKMSYIVNCLYSLMNQSYKDFEVIIVDDGSTDDSKSLIYSIINGDCRFKYYYQKNKGVSIARNLGINKATKNYICFLDADDEYDSFYIEKMLFSIKDSDACTCPHLINNNGNRKKANFLVPDSKFIYSYLANTCTPNTNSWLIRRDFIIKNKIYFKENVGWGEDMMFFSEIILKAYKVNFCNEYLTTYNTGVSDSLSVNNIDKIEKDIYWLNLVKSNVENSLLDDNYKLKCIKMIDEYRIPGSILYRILYNMDNISRTDLYDILKKYRFYLKRLSLINGLRSFKIYLVYLFIKTKLFFR